MLLLSARRAVLGGLWLLMASCTDPYMPEAISDPPSYLVVDGFINSQGVTTIQLSRTYAVASKATAPTETRATVYIEEEAGPRLLLSESSVKGTYTSAALTLNPAKRYRLHLNTATGQDYASDYVPVKTTPPIDAVNWQPEGTGLNIYVNTHDDTNSTQYYRWETDETWEIIPPYRPTVEYVNRAMRNIVVPYPTLCWGNAHSTTVLLDKTTALSQDVVSGFRVRQLPSNSERLFARYSILVQQHALSKEEYAYWDLLRKNTESIGSLFDPQPAQLTGNIHCLNNASDLAIGYISAHTLSEKRIFIRHAELPGNWNTLTGYESCVPPDTVDLYPKVPRPPTPAEILQSTFGVAGGFFIPIIPIYAPTTGRLTAYTTKNIDCVDCRKRGSAVKPSYWP